MFSDQTSGCMAVKIVNAGMAYCLNRQVLVGSIATKSPLFHQILIGYSQNNETLVFREIFE